MMVKPYIIGLLIVMSTASAIGMVYNKHSERKLFKELQILQKERDNLDIMWGQLQLEQSTRAAHSRIEHIARKQIGMINLDTRTVIFLTP